MCEFFMFVCLFLLNELYMSIICIISRPRLGYICKYVYDYMCVQYYKESKSYLMSGVTRLMSNLYTLRHLRSLFT